MPLRTRTKGEIVPRLRTSTETTFAGVTTTVAAYNDHLQSGETQTTIDIVTPRFRRRSSSGEIINNPFTSIKFKRSNTYSGYHVQRLTGSGSTVQHYRSDVLYASPPGTVQMPLVDGNRLKTIAGTEAAARVLKPALDGLVEVAEFRKTMELFHIRSGFLNRHLDSLIKFASTKKKYRQALAAGTFFANNWLKYRYGIMPLVYSANKVLELGEGPKPIRYTSRGLAEDEETSVEQKSAQGAFYRIDWDVQSTVRKTVRAGVLYEITQSHNRYGFNFSDLPAAAWELTPYSFVLDWAINVGDFIRAVTPKVGAKVLATWTTEKVTETIVGVSTPTWIGPATHVSQIPPTGSYTHERVSTYRVPGISKGLAFDVPSLKAVPTDKRIIDTFALVYQKLTR